MLSYDEKENLFLCLYEKRAKAAEQGLIPELAYKCAR